MSKRLKDGYKSILTFSLQAAPKFYETEVEPPSLDGGGPLNDTNQRNAKYRTQAPKTLITIGSNTHSGQYDPACYSLLEAMINKNQQITYTLPDGSTVQVWGYINTFKPGKLVEGTMVGAELGVEVTNRDNSDNEVGPVYTPS